ncbi:MAG: hypothetical protein OEY07_09200, partial [Gammaproteobacteria bacterium]|nr:hypothetical protein [Gammaproteobacteria bacterium]
MNRFPLTRFIPPLSACLVLLLGVNAGHAAGNMLIGQWLVTGVKTNTSTMRTTRYHYDDARLFGRVFNFSTDRISDNTPENETCTSPVLKHSRMQAAELWGKSMAVTFDDPPPSPTHYELPVAHHSSVDVIFITCKEGLYGGSLGMPKGIEGAWLLRLGDNQLALR